MSNSKMSNSKYISKGSYGCVFTPPFKCLDSKIKTTNDQVAKIFYEQNDLNIEFNKEKRQAEIIQQLDKKNKWTVKYHDYCNVIIEPTDENKKCSYIKFREEKLQLIFDNGGITLSRSKINFNKLILAFSELLLGIIKMNKNNYVHLDIKPDNILYNSELNKLSIIDFGLSFKIESNKNKLNNDKKGEILNHNYPYFPPEFKIYFKKILNTGILNLDFDPVNNLKNKILLNYDYLNLQKYKSEINANIEEEIINLIKKCEENIELFKINFDEKYIYKIDVYSLGISFIQIYLQQLIIINEEDKELFDKFMEKIIIPITKIDPDDRYDAKKAKKELDSLLKEYKIPLKISNPSRTNLSRTNPSRTNPSRTNPSRTNQSRTNQSRTNPSRTKISEPKKINPELKLLTYRFNNLKLTSPVKRKQRNSNSNSNSNSQKQTRKKPK
jgi:serine/threonine protein kinase